MFLLGTKASLMMVFLWENEGFQNYSNDTQCVLSLYATQCHGVCPQLIFGLGRGFDLGLDLGLGFGG